MNNAELILSGEGRIYHLNIHAEDIAPTILLVGDPQRVPVVSAHFPFKTCQPHFAGEEKKKKFFFFF